MLMNPFNALQHVGCAGRRRPDRAASTQRPVGSVRTAGIGRNAPAPGLHEVRGHSGNERQRAEKGGQQSEDIPFHTGISCAVYLRDMQ